MVKLHGPVRVADATPAGHASITLSLPNWPGQPVAPTTHTITVLPFQPSPPAVAAEPLANEFIATLPHPADRSSLRTVAFSPDGTRRVVAATPSGVLQLFDVATRRERWRIEPEPGPRESFNRPVLSSDGATLFVPVGRQTNEMVERDGKRVRRSTFTGEIRRWEMATGNERPAILTPPGSAPLHAELAHDGRTLLVSERSSYEAPAAPKQVLMLIDAITSTRRVLWDGPGNGLFASDGRSVYVNPLDIATMRRRLIRIDTATGEQRAEATATGEGRLSLANVAPDGTLVAAMFGGTVQGAGLDVRFFDPMTLAERGRLTGPGAAEQNGFGAGRFTPDSQRYILLDGAGNARVWNVAGRRLERVVPLGTEQQTHTLAINPDSRTLAVAWSPKAATDSREPDAADLPQARIVLVDLDGKQPSRTLIAPRGYPTALAFAPDGKTLALGGWGGVHLFVP